jgi:hypothetical protein
MTNPLPEQRRQETAPKPLLLPPQVCNYGQLEAVTLGWGKTQADGFSGRFNGGGGGGGSG